MRISSLLLALLVLGCGSASERQPVFPVAGRLTFQGQPMAGAMLTFHPLGDTGPRALRAQATADGEGKYRMTTYTTGDGVPPGEYAVTLYWPGKRTAKPRPGEEEDDMPPDRLQRAYTTPATTKLRATVREQVNALDFSLP